MERVPGLQPAALCGLIQGREGTCSFRRLRLIHGPREKRFLSFADNFFTLR